MSTIGYDPKTVNRSEPRRPRLTANDVRYRVFGKVGYLNRRAHELAETDRVRSHRYFDAKAVLLAYAVLHGWADVGAISIHGVNGKKWHMPLRELPEAVLMELLLRAKAKKGRRQ